LRWEQPELQLLRDGDASCYASTSLQESPPASEKPVRTASRTACRFADFRWHGSAALYSKQAAMTPPQQSYQQVLTCSPAPRLAEVDLLEVASCHQLCAICQLSATCKKIYSQTQLYTSYGVAYSFDLHPGLAMLQLPVCAASDKRSRFRLRIYCVWSTSPSTCQLRSKPCC